MSDDQGALFELSDLLGDGALPEAAPAGERLSATRRQTRRIAGAVELGAHPLAYLGARRHPDTIGEPFDPGDEPGRPLTCGTCRYREPTSAGNHRVAKCMVTAWRPGSQPTGKLYAYHPRLTHSARSDVRRWWPACRDYAVSLRQLALGAGVPRSRIDPDLR